MREYVELIEVQYYSWVLLLTLDIFLVSLIFPEDKLYQEWLIYPG